MSNDKSMRLPVSGMHCRSCEILIEDSLKDIAGIESVAVSHKRGEVIIKYKDQAINYVTLQKAVKAAGYQVAEAGKLPWLTKNKKEYYSLGIAFLILAMIYLTIKGLNIDLANFSFDMSSPTWGLVLLVGLVAGFSTCMALVGGLSLGLSARFVEKHPTATTVQKFRPHIFLVLGRILSYAFFGGLLGLLGTVFKFSSLSSAILMILVGAVMLLMGLQLINIFPRLESFKLMLPKGLSRALGFSGTQKEYSHKQAMILGAITFFLPCGFTQAMQIYTISTGSFISGALVMTLFAIGSAPGLLSIGGVSSLVRGSFKEKFFKLAGLAVIFFAIFNFTNAFNLINANVGGAVKEVASSDPNVTMEKGVQIVKMTELSNGYSPNSFSIKKGVPVKWIITAKAPYSCASSIVIPKLGISKNLRAGENIIQFTPKEAGRLPFSCSMGMYTGSFNVY